MIVWLVDDHYGVKPGRCIFDALGPDYTAGMVCYENTPGELESDGWLCNVDLLVLDMIAGTNGQRMPGEVMEQELKAYVARGGNVLLLHGASAAFWPWAWWRELVGLRWVRPEDPDGVKPSTHPVAPYRLERCKSRHPLAATLPEWEVPEDEIYIELECTAPVMPLLRTRLPEGSFCQAYETVTPYGGHWIGYLPGHRPEVTTHPQLLTSIRQIIDYFKKY